MQHEHSFTTRIINLVQNLISSNDKDNQLESVLALMPGHVYWKDIKGRYLGCNDNFATTLGLRKRADIKGKTDHDFLPTEQANKITINDQKIITGNIPTEFEEQGYTQKHKHAVFLTQKIPLRSKDEKITGLVGISLDITERKALEQKLQTAKVQEGLQEARIKAMKAIAASLAHELRTPLSAISNFTDTQEYLSDLATGYTAAKEAKLDIPLIRPTQLEVIKDAFQHIAKEADYSNSVINLLLTNLRELETAQKDFEICSINDCINEVINRYPFANQKQADLVKITDIVDFKFKGKALLVSHILFNLMKNALHYLEKAGKGDITIWTTEGENFNELHFKDTGAGIPAKYLPHVFEHFFSKRENGTGIGLSFCQMVMQNMGGEMKCFSEEGEYAEFVLYFSKL